MIVKRNLVKSLAFPNSSSVSVTQQNMQVLTTLGNPQDPLNSSDFSAPLKEIERSGYPKKHSILMVTYSRTIYLSEGGGGGEPGPGPGPGSVCKRKKKNLWPRPLRISLPWRYLVQILNLVSDWLLKLIPRRDHGHLI